MPCVYIALTKLSPITNRGWRTCISRQCKTKKKEIKIKKQEKKKKKKKTKKKEQRHTKRRRSCKRVKSPVKLQIKSGSSYYITLHSRQLDKRARTVM
ncbi:hypothetical protein HN011_010028 [Eciton burchellii]|nr:hypothetical protein HN011_010028 [Eciton burchellii]